MSHARPQDPSTVPAGFWLRGLAVLADYVLEVIAVAVLLVAIGADPDMATGEVPVDSMLSAFIVHLLPVFATIVLWSRWQATPGKMMIRARIVDARTGAPASTGQLLVRYLGYIVSILSLGIGFLWAAFDQRKQTWHDKLARTMVVRPRPAEATMPARAVLPPPFPALSTPAVVWPRCAVGAGPWSNPGTKAEQPSLLWLTADTLHMASVKAVDLPGMAAAAAAGHTVPSRAVPLWCLHSVEGPTDSPEISVTYAVQGGKMETTETRLGTAVQREQFLCALQHHLGHGWCRRAERENRWALTGNLLLLMLVIGVGTLCLRYAAEAGEMPEVRGSERAQLIATVVMLAAKVLGSHAVGLIGAVVMVITGLVAGAVLIAPPGRVAIRRTTGAPVVQPPPVPYACTTG